MTTIGGPRSRLTKGWDSIPAELERAIEAAAEALEVSTTTIRRRSVRSIAKAILLGQEVSAEELRKVASHVLGPRHLLWEGRAACTQSPGSSKRAHHGGHYDNPWATDSIAAVECGACKRTRVYKLAVALRDGSLKP